MKYLPIKELKRAEYNPRQISELEMEALMLSIKTHGFVEPIVVNMHPDRRGTIIGGHQRLTAIEKIIGAGVHPNGLVFEDSVWSIPVFEVKLTLQAEKELNIALNKIHGEFDEAKLSDLMLSLKGSETILSTGFSPDELVSLTGGGSKDEPAAAGKTDGCSRCQELERQIAGHEHKSGHKIKTHAGSK